MTFCFLLPIGFTPFLSIPTFLIQKQKQSKKITPKTLVSFQVLQVSLTASSYYLIFSSISLHPSYFPFSHFLYLSFSLSYTLISIPLSPSLHILHSYFFFSSLPYLSFLSLLLFPSSFRLSILHSLSFSPQLSPPVFLSFSVSG